MKGKPSKMGWGRGSARWQDEEDCIPFSSVPYNSREIPFSVLKVIFTPEKQLNYFRCGNKISREEIALILQNLGRWGCGDRRGAAGPIHFDDQGPPRSRRQKSPLFNLKLVTGKIPGIHYRPYNPELIASGFCGTFLSPFPLPPRRIEPFTNTKRGRRAAAKSLLK